MNSFAIGLITVLALFAFCMIIAYVVCVINEKTANEKTSPQGDAKIYYITNFAKQKKPKKKKKPNIALKGTVINPEQFHKVFYDSSDEFNE